MLDAGVYLPPSAFEAWFLSAAHDDGALDRIVSRPARRSGGRRAGSRASRREERDMAGSGRSCTWCGTARCDNPDGPALRAAARLPPVRERPGDGRPRAAEYLRGNDIVHLRCSPLERAQETMAPFAEALGLPVTTDGRVIEADELPRGAEGHLRRHAPPTPAAGGCSETPSSPAGASRTSRSSPGCGWRCATPSRPRTGTRPSSSPTSCRSGWPAARPRAVGWPTTRAARVHPGQRHLVHLPRRPGRPRSATTSRQPTCSATHQTAKFVAGA